MPSPTDPWGCFAVLKGTPWGDLIPVISGEVYSHGLHGYPKPFLAALGRPPHACSLKVPEGYRICSQVALRCPMQGPHCHPCPKVPDCYEPPGLTGALSLAVTLVIQAWAENRYVVVVEGPEFSL